MLYFCNPNIAPESEFEYRSRELKRLVSEMGLDIEIIEEPYDSAPFYALAKGLEDLPERGERCRKCIALRLEMAGAKARELGTDYFTTTLTISPHKDCAFINECGLKISQECGVKYLARTSKSMTAINTRSSFQSSMTSIVRTTAAVCTAKSSAKKISKVIVWERNLKLTQCVFWIQKR